MARKDKIPPITPKQFTPPQKKNEATATISQVVACFLSSAFGVGAGGG
jgi:hypothetical protein